MLYEEDMFHPLNPESLIDKSVIKKFMVSSKKGFLTIKRKINHKNVNINIYSSGETGSNIRNAITGEYYSDRIGTKREDLYYKIGISTGDIGGDSVTLFFDSPEQYERHFFTTIPVEDKEKWYNKHMEFKIQNKISTK